jgi:hypothetical protein
VGALGIPSFSCESSSNLVLLGDGCFRWEIFGLRIRSIPVLEPRRVLGSFQSCPKGGSLCKTGKRVEKCSVLEESLITVCFFVSVCFRHSPPTAAPSPPFEVALRGCYGLLAYKVLAVPLGLADGTSLRPLRSEEVLRADIVESAGAFTLRTSLSLRIVQHAIVGPSKDWHTTVIMSLHA